MKKIFESLLIGFTLLVGFTVSLALVGCGANPSALNGPGSSGSFGSSSDSSSSSAADGTWKLSCLQGASDYVTDTIQVSGSSITHTTSHYTDASCSTLEYSVIFAQTSATDSSASAPSGATAVDLTLQSVSLQPGSGYVQTFTADQVCGITSWTAGQSQDVTGKTCGSDTFASKGSVEYTLYEIASSQLFLGDESGSDNGSTAALRPTSLEPIGYTKQ